MDKTVIASRGRSLRRTCFAASQFLKDSADFTVMPHSSPDMSNGGGLPSPLGTHIASWYAKKLGVPVAMVNKVGRSYKPPPNEINGVFPGRSAIVDSDGTVLQSMDDKEGIGIASITLDPGKKTRADQVCTGVGIAELAVADRRELQQWPTSMPERTSPAKAIPPARRRRFRSQGSPEIFSLCAPQRMHAFEAGRQLVATRDVRSNFTIGDANRGSVQCEFEHL